MITNAGRPTKYDATIQKKSDEYVAGAHVDFGDPVPTVAGLACYLDVSRSTIYEWRKGNDKFSDTLDRLNTWQEKGLWANGLTGQFSQPVTKLMLANHGYHEKAETITEHKITGFEVVSDES